jgi:integrase
MQLRCHEGAWVIFDDEWKVHEPATTYLNRLAQTRAENTVKAYAGRIARFLGWCVEKDLPWATTDVGRIGTYLKTLDGLEPSTVDGHVVAITGFLRWGAANRLVDPVLAGTFNSTLKFRDPSGNEHLRRAPEIQVRRIDRGYRFLTAEQSEMVLDACENQRDRVLIDVMLTTGLRVGEALGLQWSDLHLLPSTAGCEVEQAHLHVRRRMNANGATAKSRHPRWVPVTPQLARQLAHYQVHVAELAGRTRMVFVNLYRGTIGAGLRYDSVHDLFERISVQTGVTVTPHICRHTAATRWRRAGFEIDVIATLLGHRSLTSTQIYLHASDDERRDAVAQGAVAR